MDCCTEEGALSAALGLKKTSKKIEKAQRSKPRIVKKKRMAKLKGGGIDNAIQALTH